MPRCLLQLAAANMVLNDVLNVRLEPVALGHAGPRWTSMHFELPEESPNWRAGRGWDMLIKDGVDVAFDMWALGKGGEAVPMRTLDSYDLKNVSLLSVRCPPTRPSARRSVRPSVCL
jgi:hypothetical protein